MFWWILAMLVLLKYSHNKGSCEQRVSIFLIDTMLFLQIKLTCSSYLNFRRGRYMTNFWTALRNSGGLTIFLY